MFKLLRDLLIFVTSALCFLYLKIRFIFHSKQNGITALQVSSCPTHLPQSAPDLCKVSQFAAIY